MSWLTLIVDGLREVAKVVTGIRDARRANVDDALQSTAAGRAAHEASRNAGRRYDIRRNGSGPLP